MLLSLLDELKLTRAISSGLGLRESLETFSRQFLPTECQSSYEVQFSSNLSTPSRATRGFLLSLFQSRVDVVAAQATAWPYCGTQSPS